MNRFCERLLGWRIGDVDDGPPGRCERSGRHKHVSERALRSSCHAGQDLRRGLPVGFVIMMRYTQLTSVGTTDDDRRSPRHMGHIKILIGRPVRTARHSIVHLVRAVDHQHVEDEHIAGIHLDGYRLRFIKLITVEPCVVCCPGHVMIFQKAALVTAGNRVDTAIFCRGIIDRHPHDDLDWFIRASDEVLMEWYCIVTALGFVDQTVVEKIKVLGVNILQCLDNDWVTRQPGEFRDALVKVIQGAPHIGSMWKVVIIKQMSTQSDIVRHDACAFDRHDESV